ncbi:hypothetical protein BG011_008572 [Mortierella polycephala]|uniref:Uncharacterized protein n=1 Tax=Mortierella polycephala TaxID=41804 RepID=A0A9P6PNR0_9FUNG|nr:hypothetical protein BG011_008572 [Mortierella polycephala]
MDTRKPAFRNLQPRAAAAIDFNDSDDDEGGLLSADYRAQRKTTQDLVDFFKTAPPPPSPSSLPPIVEDEKKKRTLLQRLRNRKPNSRVRSGNRNSTLVAPRSGAGSTVSTSSGFTLGKGSEVATLPNGRKYIMIAVDYKDKAACPSTSIPESTTTGGKSSTSSILIAKTPEAGSSPKRLSKNSLEDNPGSRHRSVLNSNNIKVTTTFQEMQDNDKATNFGGDQRRSIIIQAGGGESANFILDNTPFLLDNLALGTDFVMPSAASETKRGSQLTPEQDDDAEVTGHRGSISLKSGQGLGSEKPNNKVKFNITETQTPMDEESVSKALAQRIASHKTELHKNKGLLTDTTNPTITSSFKDKFNQSAEIVFPKPVTRKKVRHVQIQTQHCIMRPMYTQTEPIESLVHDLQVKELGISTNDMGTSTDHDHTVSRTTVRETTSTETGTCSVSHAKVADMVSSLSQPVSPTVAVRTSSASNGTSATGDSTSQSFVSMLSMTEQDELVQLRQQNAVLQTQVVSLQNDLAAEIRARARTAVAMQDTRDKFEMLSAIAYKKIKEMIFQRHVLEMEVRELRADVDL